LTIWSDDGREIAEHDVDNRPHPGHRRADAKSTEARFGDRRVDDAVFAELVDQAGEYLEGGARFGDIFAHQDDARIAPHFLSDRFLDRVAERQLPNRVTVSSIDVLRHLLLSGYDAAIAHSIAVSICAISSA
jgi:hypothetical protein